MKKSVFFSVLMVLLLSVFIMPATMQDAVSAPITFSGTVETIEGTTITVTGLKVDISPLDAALVAQIQTGVSVTITGTLKDGVITASVITITPAPTPVAPEGDQGEDEDENEGNAEPNYTVVFNGSS